MPIGRSCTDLWRASPGQCVALGEVGLLRSEPGSRGRLGRRSWWKGVRASSQADGGVAWQRSGVVRGRRLRSWLSLRLIPLGFRLGRSGTPSCGRIARCGVAPSSPSWPTWLRWGSSWIRFGICTESRTRGELMDPGGQVTGELTHPDSEMVPTPDARLVVPDQPTRDRAQLGREQQPRPRQQVSGRPGRDHRRGDELRERRHHHQNRQHHPRPVSDRDPRLGKPQVALSLITSVVDDPVSRISRSVVRADRRDILPEPRRRPRPADPLRQHLRRHRPRDVQQRPHPLLERRETRHHR